MNTPQRKMSADIAAAVLSGGKNKRMHGLNKSFMKINNTPLIQRTIDIFKELFAEIMIVTNSPEDYAAYKDCRIVTDRIKAIGPLGGIYSGLSQTSKPAVFFVACDMPFLHNELILRQLAYFAERPCPALVPRTGAIVEPLHAIYKQELGDKIARFVKDSGDYSISGFLKTINVCYWDLPDSSYHREIFRNVNTREELTAIQGLEL